TALEVLSVRECDRVDQDVDPTPRLADLAERRFDLGLVSHVTGQNQLGADPFSEGAQATFDGLVHVGEGQAGAGLVESLADAPGDAPLIGDADDYGSLTGKQLRWMAHL